MTSALESKDVGAERTAAADQTDVRRVSNECAQVSGTAIFLKHSFAVVVDQAWQVFIMQVFLLSVNIVLGVEG